jgi:hypothetical protein
MSRRRDFLMAAVGISAVGPSAVRAAQPWLDKHPYDWTPEDILTILNRSAWVREVPLELPPAESGTARPTKSGRGSATQFNVVVRWESGLPVRLARRIVTTGDTVPERYVVSVSRLPLAFLGAYAGRQHGEELSKTEVAAQLTASASIERGGKGIIRAEKAEWLVSELSQRVNISFPRSQNPIELAEGDVVVAASIGGLGFKARFPLKSMVYREKLEL